MSASAAFLHAAARERRGEWAFVASGQADQAFRVLFNLAEGAMPSPLVRRACL